LRERERERDPTRKRVTQCVREKPNTQMQGKVQNTPGENFSTTRTVPNRRAKAVNEQTAQISQTQLKNAKAD
jgi:hypothetical protein